ncbi:MAG: hypothetical protein O3C10_00450 [Chloroflexi bacterium]|nr:hypothetical protein [Chloroflexota bacterium]
MKGEPTPRIIVAGPGEWREVVAGRLRRDKRFSVVAEIEADFNSVEIARVPAADILVTTVDPVFTSPATKLAVALQKKFHALAVVVVLPDMHADELTTLVPYRSVWSVLSAKACEDADIFLSAVWSASRGITWVDPAMHRLLNDVHALSSRRSTPVPGFE